MNNTIDKDILIGALEKLGEGKIYIEAVIEAVKDAKMPKRHWIKGVTIRDNGCEYIGDQCSWCSCMVALGASDRYNYCPYCGRPMEAKGDKK